MMSFLSDSPQTASAEGTGAEPRRERLRFAAFTFNRAPSGFCTADVTLEWHDGQRYRGRAEGICSQYADLRLAAEATLRALTLFLGDRAKVELVGVKGLRAFDANVVIVSVLARRDGKEQRLLGCHLADEDSLRSCVLATLQATNRLLGLSVRDSTAPQA
jgi:hypothetical protein